MVSEDRAQLLLVGGVLVALAIVASVVLLNSVYAPGTLRTADIETDTEDLTHLHDELEHALEGLFVRSGGSESGGAGMPFVDGKGPGQDFNPAFDANVSGKLLPAYSNLRSDRVAGVLTVNFTGGETGWAVYQQNGTTFVGPGGNSSWRVAEEVEELVRVQLTVTDVAEGNLGGGEGASFVINDSSTTWRLNVTASDVWVVSGGVRSDPLCGANVTVDDYDRIGVHIVKHVGHVTLLNASSGRTVRCRDFDVARAVGTDATVRFENGDGLVGNYTVTGQGARPSFGPGNEYPESEGPVIVNPQFEVTYVSSGVTYTSEFALYNRTQS